MLRSGAQEDRLILDMSKVLSSTVLEKKQHIQAQMHGGV